MIHAQQNRALGRIPDTDATFDMDPAGIPCCSIYRYGGIVVVGPEQYERLGDGIEFLPGEESAEV